MRAIPELRRAGGRRSSAYPTDNSRMRRGATVRFVVELK